MVMSGGSRRHTYPRPLKLEPASAPGKAVALAEANGDPSLDAFKKNVARLSGAAKSDAK
jgi:hypothetical protein